MKARIPLSSRQRKVARQEIDRIWEEMEEEKYEYLTRRILKTFIDVMYTEFGWGPVRLTRLVNAFTKRMEEADTDEVYWEHIDQVVIDRLGLNFKRDYTNKGRVITYDD